MTRSYFVVDAFASEPFTGNAAGVVLDATGLDEQAMQSVAAEINLSETTFILPPKISEPPKGIALSVRFRWFTPTMETGMCGHASLAAMRVLLEAGRVRNDDPHAATSIRIETGSGVLTGYIESVPGNPNVKMFWLDLLDPVLTSCRISRDQLAAALRISPNDWEPDLPMRETQDLDVVALVRDFTALNNCRPDMAALGDLFKSRELRGLSLATARTVTPSVHLQSRFFAPAAGIDEDPVTGSVHGPLAAFAVEHGLVPVHDGLAGLTCVQGKPGGRTGLVNVLVQKNVDGTHAVRIGGRTVVTMKGTLYRVPSAG